MFAITVKNPRPTFDEFMGVLQDHVTVKSSEDKADILQTFSDLFQKPGVAVDGVKTAMPLARGGATLRPSVSPLTARVGGAGEPAGLVLSARPGIGSSASGGGGGGGGGGAAVSASVPKDDGVRGGSGSVLDLGHGGSGVSPLRSDGLMFGSDHRRAGNDGPPGAGSAVEEKPPRLFGAIQSGSGAADLPTRKRGRGSDTPGHHPISTVEVGTAAVIKEELRHEDVRTRKQRKAEADADVEEIDLTVTPPDPPAHVPTTPDTPPDPPARVPTPSLYGPSPEPLYERCERCDDMKVDKEWEMVDLFEKKEHRPREDLYVRDFVLVTRKPCGCEVDTPYMFIGGLHCRRTDFAGTCFEDEVVYLRVALNSIGELCREDKWDRDVMNPLRKRWSSSRTDNVYEPKSLAHILPCVYLFHLWVNIFVEMRMLKNRLKVAHVDKSYYEKVAHILFGFLQRRDFAVGAMLSTKDDAWAFMGIYECWSVLCEKHGQRYFIDESIPASELELQVRLMLSVRFVKYCKNPVALAKYATVESLREVGDVFRESANDNTVNPTLEYKLGVMLLYTEAALEMHDHLTCETVFGSASRLSSFLFDSHPAIAESPILSHDMWLIRAQSLTPTNRYTFMCRRLVNLYTMGTENMRVQYMWAPNPVVNTLPLVKHDELQTLRILKTNENVHHVSKNNRIAYLIGLASQVQRLTPGLESGGNENVIRLLRYFKKVERNILLQKSLRAVVVVGDADEVKAMEESTKTLYGSYTKLGDTKETKCKFINIEDDEDEDALVCKACVIQKPWDIPPSRL